MMKNTSPDAGVPVFRPTQRAFSEKSFCDFVGDVFRKNPELAVFKVIPPPGWKPWKRRPDLGAIRIKTPIKQHVFGKSGSFVCILEEQRGMSAADFKKLSEKPEHQPPAGKRGAAGDADELRERAFWSSVTNSPPIYGADTPVSLFDERVPWGWNLRRLGDWLQSGEYEVPDIPGVTSPMTYFGMWKAFFGWHKEDVDLYSINYVHLGAPKIWYAVSPKDNPRFDAMARALYPDLHRACKGFMRHKDILISPKVLRQYGVPYVSCRQEPGEFIVLNAAAYHAGFNLGFNVAEAVNFAMAQWVEAGKAAVPCTCAALPDGVALDMAIFCPELREEESSSDEEESEEDEDGDSSAEEDEEEEEQPAARGRRRPATPTPRKRGRGAKAATTPSESDEEEDGSEEEEASDEEEEGATPARKRQRGGGGGGSAAPSKPARVGTVPEIVKTARAGDVPRGAAHAQWGRLAEERPLAIVERGGGEGGKQLTFSLVHRLAKPSTKAGAMWVGLLREGPDGLFRPQGGSKLLQLGSQYPRAVRVRAEWVAPDPPKSKARAGGWALKTKRERILM